jgi:endonuclease/exonuclease/phosphatase (EEP) superfamily protein YafD
MGLVRLVLSLILGPPAFLLAAVCAGAAVAAQQGRSSLRWDILAHFAPVWFAGAGVALVIAVVAFGGLARWTIGGLALVGVVAAGTLIAPELMRSTGPHADANAPGQVKILQFNVWDKNRDPQATVEWIAAENPDIAILEETTPAFRRLVEARTGWRSLCHDCEVMIYSRRPQHLTALPKITGRRPGPLAHAAFKDARGGFTVIGVHNAWPTDEDAQQAQEARLAQVIATFPRERTIVTGDFNSTPWSFSRRRWDKAFGLPRRDRALFSWPAGVVKRGGIRIPFPLLPIDHVYAGTGWATVSVRRGPRLGSDHYPVVAILAPAAPR